MRQGINKGSGCAVMKEQIKNMVMERLDFTRDITDGRLKEMIQEVM